MRCLTKNARVCSRPAGLHSDGGIFGGFRRPGRRGGRRSDVPAERSGVCGTDAGWRLWCGVAAPVGVGRQPVLIGAICGAPTRGLRGSGLVADRVGQLRRSMFALASSSRSTNFSHASGSVASWQIGCVSRLPVSPRRSSLDVRMCRLSVVLSDIAGLHGSNIRTSSSRTTCRLRP